MIVPSGSTEAPPPKPPSPLPLPPPPSVVAGAIRMAAPARGDAPYVFEARAEATHSEAPQHAQTQDFQAVTAIRLPRRTIATIAAFALLPLIPSLIAILTELVAITAGCARDMPCALIGVDAGILLRTALREAWIILSVFSFGGLTLWLVPAFIALHRKIFNDAVRLAIACGLTALLAGGLIALPLLAVGIGSIEGCMPEAAGTGTCPLWGVEMGSVFHGSAMILLAPLLGAAAILALAIYPLVGTITRRLFGPPRIA